MAVTYACDDGGLDGLGLYWDRKAVGLHLGGLATHTVGAQVRGGVIPAFGNPLGYVANGGMQGKLLAGTYLLAVPDAALGPVELVVPNDVLFDHPTPSASQPRTDLIIAEVSDVGTSASFKRFRIVQGIAASGAPVPTANWAAPLSGSPGDSALNLGNGAWIAIARVNIPASAGAGSLGAITDVRQYTAAAGGFVQVANLASAALLQPGTPFYDLQLGRAGVMGPSVPTHNLMPGAPWYSATKTVVLNLPGVADRDYTTRGETFASFTMGGGFTLIKAKCDINLVDVLAVNIRLSGDQASENTAFDNGRQILMVGPSMRQVAPGTYTLSIDTAMVAGHIDIATVTYQVYSLGSVVAN